MSMPPKSPLFRRLGSYFNRPFAGCGILYIILAFGVLGALLLLVYRAILL